MIEIKNLTKCYGKDKTFVKALNNVSLTLPDEGLVFVLGKSGSGKSTLLNMLGGLDEITSGDILFDGTSILNLTNEQLDNFRNEYIGIIYQNYNLIPNETVYQNIISATQISSNQVTEQDINKVCEELEILDKKNILVKNLSGGQKQRVAIARALIKDPKIILADEPTGNLDNKTTKTIFSILKKIAKTKLVIVISHDIKSAEEYADRIIYLNDGQVSQHVVRNKNYKKKNKNVLVIDEENEITDEELENINNLLQSKNIKLTRKSEKFIKNTKKDVLTKTPPKFTPTKISFKTSLTIAKSFFKSTIASFIVTLILITSVIGILFFAQNFTQFDGNKSILKIAEEYNSKAYLTYKGYSYYNDPNDITKDYAVKVLDSDVKKFYDTGYTGNIYKIYSIPMYIYRNYLLEFGNISNNEMMYRNFYTNTGIGAAIVDYDYLIKQFGVNGKLDVLAGSLYNIENTTKLIVTDYFADSLIQTNLIEGFNRFVSDDPNDPYQKIVNQPVLNRYEIGAVINTNYKTRYSQLLNLFERFYKEPQNANKLRRQIRENKLFTQFLDEASTLLNIGYSLNPNYVEDYISSDYVYFARFRNLQVYNSNFEVIGQSTADYCAFIDTELKDNEAKLSIDFYNSLTGKTLTTTNISNFEEITITLANYAYNQKINEDKPQTTITVKVTGVYDRENTLALVKLSPKNFKTFKNDEVIPYALLFDNVKQTYSVYKTAKQNFFFTRLITFNAVFAVCDIVEIFSDLFFFIALGLILIILINLVSHNLRIVKKNKYRIGIYRSLGYSISSFVWACFINTAILVCATFVTSLAFTYLTTSLINYLLINGFTEFLKSNLISNFMFINFSFGTLALYMAVMLLVSIISVLAPIISIRKLKPNLILNKAE